MSEYQLASKMTDEELQRQAPEIYNLATKLDPFLKQYGLVKHTASVAVMVDASGSMEFNHLYSSGKVQTLIERMLPFAVRFDDNAEIDAWLFSSTVSEMHSITPANFKGCVDRMNWDRYMRGTDYVKAVDTVIQHYGTTTPRKHPVYLIFVTDGEPSGNKTHAIRKVAELASLGIFTQFVAIGEDWPQGDDLTPNQTFEQTGGVQTKVEEPGFLGRMFGAKPKTVTRHTPSPQPKTSGMRFLVELDEEIDVDVDSANAFAVEDPATVSEERLYALMTREYPEWLPKAKATGLINP
jgi:hypothetical protein